MQTNGTTEDEGTEVTLYVYDLSNGLAQQWGRMPTGRDVEGIWHTSVVVFGVEWFYGQGVFSSAPGRTHHGTPLRKISMGRTMIDRETFTEYIQAMRDVYRAEKYHLLEFNCNTFTNDVVGFLNGGTIPSYILTLPSEIMSTPFGQSMRPMIDQMFSGRNGPPPSASDTIETLLPQVLASAGQSGSDVSTPSLSSNLHLITSPSALPALLKKDFVVTLYTSPKLEGNKEFFEELSKKGGFGEVQFVLCEVGVAGGVKEWGLDGELEGELFKFWKKGEVVGELQGEGITSAQLEKRVAGLAGIVTPHQHNVLPLPQLTGLSKHLDALTYTTPPKYSLLISKLTPFLTTAAMTSPTLPPTTLPILTNNVEAYLTSKSPTSAQHSIFLSSATNALENLPSEEWYPVLDLIRSALVSTASNAFIDAFTSTLPSLLSFLSSPSVLDPPKPGKATLITSLKLLSNALAFPSSKIYIHHKGLEDVTKVVVRALLEQDAGVRSAGAGLGWSLVAGLWREGALAEEWAVEVAVAVLEALEREKESSEVVHRLAATLGLLLYRSDFIEAMKELLEALGAKDILTAKAGEEAVKGAEVKALLKEVASLI